MNLKIGYNKGRGGDDVYSHGRYYVCIVDANPSQYLMHDGTFSRMMWKNYKGDGYYHTYSDASAALEKYKVAKAVKPSLDKEKLWKLINQYNHLFGVACILLTTEATLESSVAYRELKNYLDEVKF